MCDLSLLVFWQYQYKKKRLSEARFCWEVYAALESIAKAMQEEKSVPMI